VGAGRRAGLGSLGGAHPGILAVIRRGRHPALPASLRRRRRRSRRERYER
jgi:hypothetical protein